MERETYSTYEAKARFSEIQRKVRRKKRIVITHRGEPVAEIGPASTDDESLDERLARMEGQGVIESGKADLGGAFEAIARVTGALERFLDDRE